MANSRYSEGLSGSKLYRERELWKEPATGLQLWVCSVEVEHIFYPTSIEQPALCQPLTELTYHFSRFSGFLKSAQQLYIPALGLPPVKAAISLSFHFLISESPVTLPFSSEVQSKDSQCQVPVWQKECSRNPAPVSAWADCIRVPSGSRR